MGGHGNVLAESGQETAGPANDIGKPMDGDLYDHDFYL
jgi:hypothetical protein